MFLKIAHFAFDRLEILLQFEIGVVLVCLCHINDHFFN